MKRVLKWTVQFAPDARIGSGEVVLVAMQYGFLTVWTEEDEQVEPSMRPVGIFGTGYSVSDDYEHLGSVLDGSFVWHLYGERRKP